MIHNLFTALTIFLTMNNGNTFACHLKGKHYMLALHWHDIDCQAQKLKDCGFGSSPSVFALLLFLSDLFLHFCKWIVLHIEWKIAMFILLRNYRMVFYILLVKNVNMKLINFFLKDIIYKKRENISATK